MVKRAEDVFKIVFNDLIYAVEKDDQQGSIDNAGKSEMPKSDIVDNSTFDSVIVQQ